MAKQRRLLIVTDGEHWFVRRVSHVKRDLTRNETVYACDKPIGRRFNDIASAVRRAKDALSNRKSRAWR